MFALWRSEKPLRWFLLLIYGHLLSFLPVLLPRSITVAQLDGGGLEVLKNSIVL